MTVPREPLYGSLLQKCLDNFLGYFKFSYYADTRHCFELKIHLLCHEVPESDEAEVVSVGAFVQILHRIVADDAQRLSRPIRQECNLMHAWKAEATSVVQIQSRNDNTCLQRTTSVVPRDVGTNNLI